MQYILDLVPEPSVEQVELAARITPWLVGYVVVGLLILAAVLVTIKLIKRSKKSKDKPQ